MRFNREKAVFDRGDVGQRVDAERRDEPGGEQHETDPEVATTLSVAASGRNEDQLLREYLSSTQEERSYHWDPKPPQIGGCIRRY